MAKNSSAEFTPPFAGLKQINSWRLQRHFEQYLFLNASLRNLLYTIFPEGRFESIRRPLLLETTVNQQKFEKYKPFQSNYIYLGQQ